MEQTGKSQLVHVTCPGWELRNTCVVFTLQYLKTLSDKILKKQETQMYAVCTERMLNKVTK